MNYKDMHNNSSSFTFEGIEIKVEVDATPLSYEFHHKKEMEVSKILVSIDIENNKIDASNDDRGL